MNLNSLLNERSPPSTYMYIYGLRAERYGYTRTRAYIYGLRVQRVNVLKLLYHLRWKYNNRIGCRSNIMKRRIGWLIMCHGYQMLNIIINVMIFFICEEVTLI